jgi:hypothetical protein
LCNFRVRGRVWGVVFALACHGTSAQTSAPSFVSPAYTAGVRNAVIVCATGTTTHASTGALPKSDDLPFIYGVAPVAGAPYSAIGVMDSTTTFVDGNRISLRETTRFFRDRQGRTRIEHTLPPAHNLLPIPAIVLINDPVSGECYVLDAPQKIARVLSHPAARGVVIHPPVAQGMPPARLLMPGFDLQYGTAFSLAVSYFAPEDGTQAALGEKAIDGIPVVGTRMKHHVRAGEYGNEQPIFITVENWFSPGLGVTLKDTQHSTIGGEVDYRLERITRSEPDASLFQVPPEYTRKLETPALRTELSKMPAADVRAVQPALPPPARFVPVPCPAQLPYAPADQQSSASAQPDGPQLKKCMRLILPGTP